MNLIASSVYRLVSVVWSVGCSIVHVVAVQDAVIVIETLPQRAVLEGASQVPFSDAGCCIPERFQGIGNGDFPGRHAPAVAGKENLNDARPYAGSAGQQR